jgi:hypothetical protein
MADQAQTMAAGGAVSIGTGVATHAGARSTERRTAIAGFAPWNDLLGIAGVLLVTSLLAWHRLWLENGLGYLDISTFYMPWYAHLGEAIRHFDIPGWNPYQFSGTPFAGDPQSGWWYFPAMAIFTIFSPVRAYQVYIIFHLAFAGITCYLLGRRLGLAVIPSLAAGAIYQSGPFVSHISCCLIHIQLGAWIPAALLSVEQVVRASHLRQRAFGWVLTGFCMSQMMSAWPGQGMYNGCLLTGGYLAFRLIVTRQNGALGWNDRVIRLVGDSASVLVMAVLWAAAGLLPRTDIVSRTNVAWGQYEGYENDRYSAGWTLHILLDHLFTDNNGYQSLLFYLGAPVTILAVTGVVLAWRKPWVKFLSASTMLTAIMTMRPTPLHTIVFAVLPKFEELHSHVPSRILAVQWIGPTMLAATAMHELMQSPSRRVIFRAASIAFGLWALVILILRTDSFHISAITIVCGILTVLIIGFFSIVNTPPGDRYSSFIPHAQALLAGLLILLILTDPAGGRLISTIRSGETMSEVIRIPTGPVPRNAAALNAADTDPGGAGEFLQRLQREGDYVRYFGYDNVLQEGGEGYLTTYRENFANPTALSILVNARAMRLHIFDIQGYNPVQLKNYVTYLTAVNGDIQNYHDAQILPGGIASPLLNILNATYIIIPNELITGRPRADVLTLLARYPSVFQNNQVRILKNTDAMPRAWIVHAIAYAQPDAAPDLIGSPTFDPALTVVLPADAQTFSVADPGSGTAESATITRYEDDQVQLDVTASADGMLVLSETYERGWKATVDGRDVPLVEAYGVVRALPIGPGVHKVVLKYEPWSLRIGFYISLLAAAISLVVIVAFITGPRLPDSLVE